MKSKDSLIEENIVIVDGRYNKFPNSESELVEFLKEVQRERKPGSGRKNDIITDDVKAFIMKCLNSDQKAPRKQQHTAHKIYTRLVAECGFDGCEASVRRTVAELKGKVSNVFVPLSYDPAEAVQVDWGEATVILGGIRQKIQITQHTAPGRPPACRPSYTHRGEKGDENLPPGKGGSNGSPSKGSDECGR